MIKFRHYKPNNFTSSKHYGFCFEVHKKRKVLDVFAGGHVFAFWVGRDY